MTNKKHSLGRYLFYGVGSLLALIVVAVLVLTLVRVPIQLNSYKGIVESSASSALGRNVKIDGDIKVTTSLWPYFEIQGLRILDSREFGDGDLANMELARITVGLVPLLKKKIHIREFRVESLALNLIRAKSGAVNWEFDGAAGTSDVPVEAAEVTATEITLATEKLAIDVIDLGNISVDFRDESSGEELDFQLNQANGSAAFGEPMTLSMQGVLLDEPFSVDVEASSLDEFLAMSGAQLDLTVGIAKTQFEFFATSSVLDGRRELEFDVAVEGDNLGTLGDMLNLDLPPLKNYRAAATFSAEPGRVELNGAEVTVQNSTLTGSLTVDKTGPKPFAAMSIAADSVQLDDFDTEGWTADESAPEEEITPSTDDSQSLDEQSVRSKLLSPETLQRADLKLDIEVGEVLSGGDSLGSGAISLELKDGRLAIDPLRLKTSRASLSLSASVKPDVVASDASLRVVIENFDLGVLARLSKPDSDVGGPLNMDIDVKMSAAGVRDLLTGANGYIDVAGNPENVASGLVDLWAVNLLSSVVASSVEDENSSEINCVISRWSIEDGLMTARQLTIDTSRIRICGEGSINFKEQSFDLEVFPTAKKPEFFSLAAPMVVSGKFEDFNIGAKGGAVAVGTTAVRFAVSPLTTPIKRMVREDLPEDGSDVCGLPIGPHDGELDTLPGC
jgi:uncharacterized protein involved in outer membrane biogenesis